ncbi:MAG: zinc ribbon domain-containing protein [Candidatus Methanofastidiosa archaeon]|jgi:hypothetical protein|nr:zinc ribbon domain-containing protein [Candidatus Methanofastidiosa archaeon]
MEDTFNLEVKVPDFIQLLGEEGKTQILDEIKKKVEKDVSNIVIKAAREIMSEKLGLDTRESPFGPLHTKHPSTSSDNGIKSDVTCPNCQKPLEVGVKFCRFCGQKIS